MNTSRTQLVSAAILSLAFADAAAGQPDAEAPGGLLSRDDHPVLVVRGNHPRREDIWPEYAGLKTALRENITLSDVLLPDSDWKNYLGEPVDWYSESAVNGAGPDQQMHVRNQYQNLLAEVWNFKPGANAVAMWGDSVSLVPGARSWGATFSARSNGTGFATEPRLRAYWPAGVQTPDAEQFDCQLIGVEIDVLNGGKPGVVPNMSKTALQIVGFGWENSMAMEVRCEDSKAENTEHRRGQFHTGIYFVNSLSPEGKLLEADVPELKTGLDLSRPLCREGAIRLHSEGPGTGIVYNGGRSGEIFGGARDPELEDGHGWLTLRCGVGGVRVVGADGVREILSADNDGQIRVNGRAVDLSLLRGGMGPTSGGLARDALVAGLTLAVVWLGQTVRRLRARLALAERAPTPGRPATA